MRVSLQPEGAASGAPVAETAPLRGTLDLGGELRQMGVRLTPEQQRLRQQLEQGQPQVPLPNMPPEQWGMRYQQLLNRGERQREGVFFTPPLLAERVVSTLLAPVLEQATPHRPPRILDPACGAGAFLFAAWRVMERWALRWIQENQREGEEGAPAPSDAPGAPPAAPQLPALIRRKLLHALHGIDRDPLALALARRGLRQLAGVNAPLNLICADSLLAEWPEVEIITGNPPWVRAGQQAAADRAGGDLYIRFVERALDRLDVGGRAGLVLSNRLLYAQYAERLRGRITAGRHLLGIEDLAGEQHFDGASTYTCLLYLSHDPSFLVSVRRGGDGSWIPASGLGAAPWPLRVGTGAPLEARLAALPTLGSVARIFVGLQTSADRVFHQNDPPMVEREICLPLLSAPDVQADGPIRASSMILFPYRISGAGAGRTVKLIPWEELRALYPRAAAWLNLHRADLEAREGGRLAGPEWYRFGRHQNLLLQAGPKLCLPRLARRLIAGREDGAAVLDNADVIGVRPLETGGVSAGTAAADTGAGWTLEGLMALLNSRLLSWYFRRISPPFRSGYHSANRQYLERVPVLADHAAALDGLGRRLLAGEIGREEVDGWIADAAELSAEDRAVLGEG